MSIRFACGLGFAIWVAACSSDPPEFAKDSNSSSEATDSSDDSGHDAGSETSAADDVSSSDEAQSGDTGDDDDDDDSDDSDSDEADDNEADDSETDDDDSDEADDDEADDNEADDSMAMGECMPGMRRACSAGGAMGNCADGEQACGDDASWGECSIEPSSADDCAIPGDDADCDGTPNTGCTCVDGQEQSCGPSQAIGRCTPGVSRCVDDVYQPCEGAVEAIARDCSSSEDNDCDGVPDDTKDGVCQCEPGSTQACEEHVGLDGNGQCQAGVQTCVAGADGSTSAWDECTGSVGPELQDACDGEDDSNCNGTPNEGCSCTSSAECDDSAACTHDTCEDGACTNSITSGFCRISGQCVAHNAQDPDNPCRYCDANQDQSGWSNSAPGTSCDDGVWCNGSDSCNAGQCTQHQFATDRCAEQSGPCVLPTCDEANRNCFRNTDYVCDPGSQELECVGSANTCGSDVRAFNEVRYCDGDQGQCLGTFGKVNGATQDCGSGYCDGSSFTCEQLGCGNTWCDDGLCWTTDNPTTRPLAEATSYCENLGRHGLTWRLPSITEWLDISRGCNDATGSAVDDVNYHSTCTSVPCENGCPHLQGPNPYGCYWPTELGDCNGVQDGGATGRYWSSTGGIWFQAASAWAYTLSSGESLNVRCVTAGSGP